MLEVWIALLLVAVTAYVLWKRSTSVLRSAVNLPPVVGAATEEASKKKKKVHQSEVALRQEQVRDTLVLFGTTTGTSWQFAEKLVRDGQSRFGLTMRSQSLEDYDFESELHLESAVVVIVPTYDGGTPNATTKDFFNYLRESAVEDFRTSKALLGRVSFAVFGLGDTVYGDNFAVVGRKIDEWLKTLGGQRMLARGAGDAQYSAKQFETWMGRLWPSLLAALGEKDLLAKLRKEMKSRKASSALKEASYASDDEENEDKEPLADLEDLGSQTKNATAEEDDDEGSAEEDVTEIGPGGEGRKELLTPALTAALSKQGYQLIGTHSGVKLCRWTKGKLQKKTNFSCVDVVVF